MPERRCILTFDTLPVEQLVRLVQGPDGVLVPDVAAKLPGRGLWVKSDGISIRDAVKSGQFAKAVSRSLKAGVPKSTVPGDLAELITRLLTKRCLDRLGLEQRSGNLITGFDKIGAALTKKGTGVPALVLAASDGADDGRRKIRSAVGHDVPVVDLFDREQLSASLGRDNVVHALLMQSGGADKLKADIGRLEGMIKVDQSR
ncbi:DUF448 domain-containing protein [Kordiimonas aquimaris]|uniref:DUF448 domain-containing protein n=1 Tax=Kordiimonas aquimaris TaxID=707591 RepID=UPI0021D2207B|nr:DUF448 domain-containing protein [Kordiimonas aquimaris]